MGSVFPPQSNPYAQDVSDPTMAASQEYRRYELDHSDNAMSEYAKSVLVMLWPVDLLLTLTD